MTEELVLRAKLLESDIRAVFELEPGCQYYLELLDEYSNCMKNLRLTDSSYPWEHQLELEEVAEQNVSCELSWALYGAAAG